MVYDVKLGQFHGVTVPGGGKRRSVMNPIVPKSRNEMEKDSLRDAFYCLEHIFEDSRDNVSVDNLIDAFQNDAVFKSCLVDSIYWAFVKRKDWSQLRAKFADQKDGIISFDDFYDFSRDLYTESFVSPERVRSSSKFNVELNHLRDSNLGMRDKGEKVEARIRHGPLWLTGTIIDVDDETETYTILYDNVTKIHEENRKKSKPRKHTKKALNFKASTATLKQIREIGERQLVGFIYDIISIRQAEAQEKREEEGGGDDSGGTLAFVSKKFALEIITSAISAAGSGSPEEVGNLSAMVNRSPAILSLLKYGDIRRAFDAVMERGKAAEGEGDGYIEGSNGEYDKETIDTLTKGTFVEFFIGVSEILRFNDINL